VAKTQTGAKQYGLTRGKAVLIGVLAIALVGVLYVQYGPDSGDAKALDQAATRGTARTPARSTSTKPAATDADTASDTQGALLEFDQAKWKSPKLSKVIAYDPFALPPGFPQPASFVNSDAADETAATAQEKSKQLADALAELRTQLDELRERGVHVIVGQKDQYVAMIGDRRLHVGDQINGFTVTEIDPKEGVRVEWKEPQ
jgi:hypothetical protein